MANKADECHEMTVEQVLEELIKLWPIGSKPTIIVISGGEPMMQQTALSHLVEELHYQYCPVHIETAGTIMPMVPELLHQGFDTHDQYVVSPKLANSGNPYSKRYKPKVLRALRDQGAYFKFVVSGPSDFEEIDQIVKECNLDPSRIMCMPEGTHQTLLDSRARQIVDEVLKRGYGLSPRMHVMIWGDERGR
jgi:organic radical activating enzyme